MMKTSLGVLSILISLTVSKKLPSNFKICAHLDPNLNECLTEAIASAIRQMRNGLPEIDAPPLDPLVIPNATLEKDEFIMNFNDIHLYNITDTVIHNISTTISPNRFYVIMLLSIEEVLWIMNYRLKGSLLFTIDGEGKAIIKFKNIKFDMVLDAEIVERHGMLHYKLKTDIFRGYKRLSETFNAVLNDNWNIFFEHTRVEFEEMLGQFLMQYADHVFKYVPIKL